MKYLLQKSEEDPLWWVLTDTEAQIVCRFKEGEFNETQKFTPLNDISQYDVFKLPQIVVDMADWLRDNHYEIIFTSPQMIIQNNRERIGLQIKEAREAKGYTLRHLAKLTGIAFNHIGRIEAGRYNVTLDTLAVIADALGMELTVSNKAQKNA